MRNFTVAILNKPGDMARQEALLTLLHELDIERYFPKDMGGPPAVVGTVFQDPLPAGMKWSEFKTVLVEKQWSWALRQGSQFTHHIFLTDDLHVHPLFFEVLDAMIEGSGAKVIGLLSNHPRGPMLYREGGHAYRCNSWVVGPAYCVSTEFLASALAAYCALPDDEGDKHRRWFNDDSFLNHHNTFAGPGESWHPLPTIIEHRFDVESTVGHGDRYSRERVSWREERKVVDDGENGFQWASVPLYKFPHETERLEELMVKPGFWSGVAPMLPVGE